MSTYNNNNKDARVYILMYGILSNRISTVGVFNIIISSYTKKRLHLLYLKLVELRQSGQCWRDREEHDHHHVSQNHCTTDRKMCR
jgi:hypothetical protein